MNGLALLFVNVLPVGKVSGVIPNGAKPSKVIPRYLTTARWRGIYECRSAAREATKRLRVCSNPVPSLFVKRFDIQTHQANCAKVPFSLIIGKIMNKTSPPTIGLCTQYNAQTSVTKFYNANTSTIIWQTAAL